MIEEHPFPEWTALLDRLDRARHQFDAASPLEFESVGPSVELVAAINELDAVNKAIRAYMMSS